MVVAVWTRPQTNGNASLAMITQIWIAKLTAAVTSPVKGFPKSSHFLQPLVGNVVITTQASVAYSFGNIKRSQLVEVAVGK